MLSLGLLPRGAARYGRSCSAGGLRATVALKAGRGASMTSRRARPRAERRRASRLAFRLEAWTAPAACTPDPEHRDEVVVVVSHVIHVLLRPLQVPATDHHPRPLAVGLQDERFAQDCFANTRELFSK